MTTSMRTIRHLTAAIGLTVSVAAFAAPAVLAGGKPSTITDGRSPDTRDAANQLQLDGRSPDTRDAAIAAHQGSLALSDGRSPDTLDASTSTRPALSPVAAPTDGSAPDWFERYAAAHPFGAGTASYSATAPDWFERYAAHHNPTSATLDLRSPDTQDAALAAHANVTPQVAIESTAGFDWADAGIGAAGGFTLALLLTGGFVFVRHNGRGLAV